MSSAYGNLGWRETRTSGKSTTTLTPKPAPRPDAPPIITRSTLISRLVIVLTLLYALTFAWLSVQTHLSLGTNAFDLGNMDQAMWNTWQGRPLAFTNWEGGTIRFAAHVEPIFFLIAQAYWIYDSPLTLLVIQSVVIALGALPTFWLARAKLENDLAALAFVAAYLLSPALEIANLSDFHAVALASSFLMYAFWFAYKGWYLPFLLFAILAMSTKEQVPLTVAVMGLYILFGKRNLWVGLATILLAGLWFAVAVFVVIPYFNPSGASPYLSRYDHLGRDPLEILQGFAANPGTILPSVIGPAQLEYLRSLFEPTAYLAAASPLVLLAAPDLAINLLSNFDQMYGGQAHYGSIIAPALIISAIYATWLLTLPIKRLSRTLANVVLLGVSLLIAFASLRAYVVEVFLPLMDHLPVVTERDRLVREFIALIPPDAAVSASSSVNPHVAHREQLYLFPDLRDGLADYIFLDVLGDPFPIERGLQRFRIRQLVEEQGLYGVVAGYQGFLLLRKGEPNRVIPDEVASFARVAQARGERLDVDFPDTGLRLLSWERTPGGVLHGRAPYATVTTYWVATRPVTEVLLPTLAVRAPNGRLDWVDPYPAASAWLTTDRWSPGQVMKVEYPVVPLALSDEATLLAGLSRRNDRGEITGRVAPQPPPDMSRERVTADNWLRLGEMTRFLPVPTATLDSLSLPALPVPLPGAPSRGG